MKNKLFLLSLIPKFKFSRQWSQAPNNPKRLPFPARLKAIRKSYRWLSSLLLAFSTQFFLKIRILFFLSSKHFFLQIIYLLFLFKFFAEPFFPLVCVLMSKEADSLQKNRPSTMLWKARSVQKTLNIGRFFKNIIIDILREGHVFSTMKRHWDIELRTLQFPPTPQIKYRCKILWYYSWNYTFVINHLYLCYLCLMCTLFAC